MNVFCCLRLIPTHWSRLLGFIFFLGFSWIGSASAGISFVATMSSPAGEFFALREDADARVIWSKPGDQVGGHIIATYDAKQEKLILKKGAETLALQLPTARVQMAQDEVVAGLKKILHRADAQKMFELLHLKLRPLYDESQVKNSELGGLLKPETTTGVRELSEDEAKAFDHTLSAIAAVTGTKPRHLLWMKTGTNLSMTFLLADGDGWYLAPDSGWPPKE